MSENEERRKFAGEMDPFGFGEVREEGLTTWWAGTVGPRVNDSGNSGPCGQEGKTERYTLWWESGG
jgi:hypothetical protein